jgi:hypothetical protein
MFFLFGSNSGSCSGGGFNIGYAQVLSSDGALAYYTNGSPIATTNGYTITGSSGVAGTLTTVSSINLDQSSSTPTYNDNIFIPIRNSGNEIINDYTFSNNSFTSTPITDVLQEQKTGNPVIPLTGSNINIAYGPTNSNNYLYYSFNTDIHTGSIYTNSGVEYFGRDEVINNSYNQQETVLTISGTNGSVNDKNAIDSTSAFAIQNTEQSDLFNVDTVDDAISLDSQLNVSGGGSFGGLTQPTGNSPTVTSSNPGTGAQYYYAYTAVSNSGAQTAMSQFSSSAVTNSNPLTSSSYNTVTIPSTGYIAGAKYYDIYQCVNVGSSYTLNLIDSIPSASYFNGSFFNNGTSIQYQDMGSTTSNPYSTVGNSSTSCAAAVPSILSSDNTGSYTFTGQEIIQNASNSTKAFQIQNANGNTNLFIADTTDNLIGIDQLPQYSSGMNYGLPVA